MSKKCIFNLRIWILAFVCLGGPHQDDRLLAQEPPAKPAQESVTPSPNHDYQLAPGDVLQIRFFYNPELNEKVQIRPDGHITMSLIGEVELRSKTTAQATNELETAYKNYLKTPSITVQVEEFSSQKVFVGGEIARPGMFPLVGKLSVLDALICAGGVKATGTASTVLLIRRKTDGTPEAMQKISLRSVENQPPEASQIYLRSFDIVLVPEKRIAKVDRWVDQYLRQTIPVQMTAGFNYFINGGVLVP